MNAIEHSLRGELAELTHAPRVVACQFAADGAIPNNPELALIIYQSALSVPEQDAAMVIEQLLASNHWNGGWRGRLEAHPHYHSMAHEVVAVISGSATWQFGGKKGSAQTLSAGDVLVIPAGVGHQQLDASDDFSVVVAYPVGQGGDTGCAAPDGPTQADENIARVTMPDADPVYGADGPLMELWNVRRGCAV